MQKILIIGYLGRDPELKYSPQGSVIAQFSIATTERWKDRNVLHLLPRHLVARQQSSGRPFPLLRESRNSIRST